MSEVTDTSMHAAGDPVLGPDIIDEIILESKALEQLARTDPEIVKRSVGRNSATLDVDGSPTCPL